MKYKKCDDKIIRFISLFTDVNTGTYTCDLCGLKFSIKATFEQHKKSHSKTAEPSTGESADVSTETNQECPETFRSKPTLTEHSSLDNQTSNVDDVTDTLHSDVKSSKVNQIICKNIDCGMAFMTPKELKKHMIIHKLATYQCPKCKKIYYSKTVYDTHVRLCMPDNEDVLLVADEDIDSGPVECTVCSQLFENKKVLKFHQKFCNDNNDIDKVEGGGTNQEIEEIYLKTEIDDDFVNLMPEC